VKISPVSPWEGIRRVDKGIIDLVQEQSAAAISPLVNRIHQLLRGLRLNTGRAVFLAWRSSLGCDCQVIADTRPSNGTALVADPEPHGTDPQDGRMVRSIIDVAIDVDQRPVGYHQPAARHPDR
jgi:hypothetical protein